IRKRGQGMNNRGDGKVARIQNVATEQTVKNAPGILHRLILSNAGVAGTLTVKDGATTLIVLNVPANTAPPAVVECHFSFTSSLKITPSAVGLDTLVVFI